MTRLGIEEEIEMCHHHFEMPHHSFIFYGFWSIFIVFIVTVSQFSSYSSASIPWDNCDMNKTWQPAMRMFINQEQYQSEMRKIINFREKNSLYRKNNYSRIEYGSTPLSYCKTDGEVMCNWETKRAQVRVPDGLVIKSLTRTIELDPYFASGFRFLILECMSFRMVLALFRSSDVLTSRKRSFPKVIQLIVSLSPYISFLQSVSLFWITALHSEFDINSISMFHPYAYLFVGIFTFLEMLLDLFLDGLDGRFVLIQTPRFYIKSTLFVAFSSCFPQVVINWLTFFRAKRCHAYVPLLDGIFEYICALSMIAYHFINAQIPVQMYITPTVEDVRNVSSYPREVYFPQFQAERPSEACDSLSGNK